MQSAETKNNQLNNAKSKLEVTLDDLEAELTREKKGRTETEKTKRKLEGDLKICLEVSDEREREKGAEFNTYINCLTKTNLRRKLS